MCCTCRQWYISMNCTFRWWYVKWNTCFCMWVLQPCAFIPYWIDYCRYIICIYNYCVMFTMQINSRIVNSNGPNAPSSSSCMYLWLMIIYPIIFDDTASGMKTMWQLPLSHHLCYEFIVHFSPPLYLTLFPRRVSIW